MDVHNLDAQKNDPKTKDHFKNIKPSSQYGLSRLRSFFRPKDQQHSSSLSCGKWLKIVKNSHKVSHEVSPSSSPTPSHPLIKVEASNVTQSQIQSYQSQKMHQRVVSIPKRTFLSPSSIDYNQGTIQLTKKANGTSSFAFKVENQKDVYVASLSQSLESFMIYKQRGGSSSSSLSSLDLVGKIKVSTLISRSSMNETIIKKQFVLFSSSRMRCSWDQHHFQEPRFENNFSTNLETLAVVMKQEFLEEDEVGGWGLKFLKKSKESSRSLISMNIVIPLEIHGGPKNEPLSLIKRWKSEEKCDCEGWDLGCSLTILKGQQQKNHFNHFELFIEGSKQEMPEFRIVNVQGGTYLVQFQTKLSVLQSFSIALAFIHSKILYH